MLNGLFAGLQVYAGKWSLKATNVISEEEAAQFSGAEVVASDYGKSICLHIVEGGMAFMPLSQDSKLEVGDTLSLSEIAGSKVLTLEKQGEQDINRFLEK